MHTEKDLVTAYVDWAMQRMESGDEPFLLTIMFNQIPGSQWVVNQIMNTEIERVYAVLLTRHFRNPRRVPDVRKPLWIVCADYPVPKNHKEFFYNNLLNDGLHRHAATLVPPGSRMREGLEKHVRENHRDITASTGLIRAMEARPITETPRIAFEYAFKAVLRRRTTSTDMLILPRAQAEMPYLTAEERRDLQTELENRRLVRKFCNSLSELDCRDDKT